MPRKGFALENPYKMKIPQTVAIRLRVRVLLRARCHLHHPFRGTDEDDDGEPYSPFRAGMQQRYCFCFDVTNNRRGKNPLFPPVSDTGGKYLPPPSWPYPSSFLQPAPRLARALVEGSPFR
jgi:hypothetical protein